MLTREDIGRYSRAQGLSLGQTELDYVHHQLLSLLGRSIKNDWVFKGGTCLQKVLALDRFSEDLDFTLIGQPDVQQTVAKVLDGLNHIGLPARVKWPKSSRGTNEGTFRIQVEGPLFDGRDLSRCSVLFNLSQREDLLRTPQVTRTVPSYPDLQPYLIYHMDPDEMLAEKVRAMVKRDKARDLYDVGFLLQKGILLDAGLVHEKLSLYSMKLTKSIIKEAISKKEAVWELELAPLVHGALPSFKSISKRVHDALSRLIENGV